MPCNPLSKRVADLRRFSWIFLYLNYCQYRVIVDVKITTAFLEFNFNNVFWNILLRGQMK